MILNDRVQSRLIYCVILLSSLALLRCTSSKMKDEPQEPVKVETPAEAPKASADNDLPPELREAEKFDPATTLDEKQVQESDFYKVRKDVESKKGTLDQEWKAQDQLDSEVRKAKEDEERRKKEEQKKEEEEREKARQESVKSYNSNSKKRAHQERVARDNAAKLPTISHEEVMWNGLED